MRRILFEVRPMQHILFQPQHTFITDEKGAVLADYVGRVEQMQPSYDEMCRRLDMPPATLEQSTVRSAAPIATITIQAIESTG